MSSKLPLERQDYNNWQGPRVPSLTLDRCEGWWPGRVNDLLWQLMDARVISEHRALTTGQGTSGHSSTHYQATGAPDIQVGRGLMRPWKTLCTLSGSNREYQRFRSLSHLDSQLWQYSKNKNHCFSPCPLASLCFSLKQWTLQADEFLFPAPLFYGWKWNVPCESLFFHSYLFLGLLPQHDLDAIHESK